MYLGSLRIKGNKLKRVVSDLKNHSYMLKEDKDAEVLFNDDLGLSVFFEDKKVVAFELFEGSYEEAKKFYEALMDKYIDEDE